MKAGQALGLLAGLGALNALRGGRDGTGARFTGLLDMLDGGGAGQSGDKFEGGGLLSMLGNLFMKPLEAQQRVEEIAARTSARNNTPDTPTPLVTGSLTPLLDGKDGGLTSGNVTPRLDGKDGVIPAVLTDAQKEALVMSQAIPSAAFDYRNFEQGTEPSTLSEAQRMRAAGILAGQAAMQPITQAQLQGGAESLANASADMNSVGSLGTPDAPSIQSDPMGLLSPSLPVQSALPTQEAPQLPALDESLQRITGGVSFRQKAEEQLSNQIDGLYIMPAAERERLISKRAALLKKTYDRMMRDQVVGLGM